MTPIHLVLTVDRRHLLGCVVTMRSVVEAAAPGAELCFHVAVDRVPEGDRERLRQSTTGTGRQVTVRFVDFDVARVRHLTRSRLVSHAAYARLFLEEFLPPGIERCIYLDCDLIVARDVGELSALPLDGRTVGAVENLGAAEQAEHQARLKLSAPRYFNSGVMLIDLARWSSSRVRERARESAERIGDHLILHDQDALNVTLDDDWTAIDWRWNVRTNDPRLTEQSEVVFHFMGAPKPWEVDYDGPFLERFRDVLDRTAYRGRRPWNPAGLGRMVASARRRIPYLPGALRLLRVALRGGGA